MIEKIKGEVLPPEQKQNKKSNLNFWDIIDDEKYKYSGIIYTKGEFINEENNSTR